jgi:demethylmenaquinone methyltransferase/2-methoxy-6-polyprenyl-1,4-benzoquinol methylase
LNSIDAAALAEQAAYYRARAAEYDEWWQRAGRYDKGAEATAQWRSEVAEVEAALAAAELSGDVLELACGTGWWTERLARSARSLTCIDASPETIAINRARLRAAGLAAPTYAVEDLFNWEPDTEYDAVFFSFWLSHVPRSAFTAFWSKVGRSLRPGGQVFLIDSAPDPTSSTHRTSESHGMQERRLNDGSTFRIIKLFYEPAELMGALNSLGWRATIARTRSHFIFGSAQRG